MVNIKLAFKTAFKDLTRQKARTAMGVFGVMISIGLLAIVLFLADSISVSFVGYLSADAGDQDMVISIRHYNGEPTDRSSIFEYQPVIEYVQNTTDSSGNLIASQISNYIPRLEASGKVNISVSTTTTALTNLQLYTKISGINVSLENSLGFGYFNEIDSSTLINITSLPLNHCAIYYGFNDVIKYSEGDTIQVEMSLRHGSVTLTKTVNLIIDQIFDFTLKWPGAYRSSNLIVVDIQTLYTIYESYDNFEGKCSKLIMTLTSGNDVYDVRNVAASETIMRDLAGAIIVNLGLNEYNIEMPKLQLLGYSEFLSMGITIIFVFVSIISMLIAGILINGILKTSVEERIREFGINRTLGAHRTFNLWIVIVQGFLLCNFGTLAGIFVAYFGSEFLIVPIASEQLKGLLGTNINFTGSLESILIAYSMGIGVGLLVSMSPALQVMRLQLIESIHPYRHEDTLYHLQKKATVNYKLIIVGIILAANGGFIYFVMPRLMMSMDMTLMAGTFVMILMIFLIGLTLAGLGLMPLILRIAIFLFKPFSKRLHQIIKIFVFRYQRRNNSTVVMFALSFSFVAFASTTIQTMSSQVSIMVRLRYGSDLVIETTSWAPRPSSGGMFGGGMMGGGMDFGGGGGLFSTDLGQTKTELYGDDLYTASSCGILSEITPFDTTKLFTSDFKNKLLSIDGIEKVSTVLAAPWQLTQIYSSSGKEFDASIADFAGLSSSGIDLFGIDIEYISTVDTNYVVMTRGEMKTSFDQLYNTSAYYCVISEGLALSLNLNLGDKVRILIERGDEAENYEFFIAGMASSLPGFSIEFGGSTMGMMMGSSRSGVLISQATYIDLLDLPEPAWIDKIFIKLQQSKLAVAGSIKDQIDDLYKNDYDYQLYNLERMVSRREETFAVIDILFTLILMATVVICLFGLLSSSYSAILERKKEIGIIRTLGLKGKEINRLFIIEALIIMLSSGTVGILVGWVTGVLLSQNLSLFTDMPYQPAIPYLNIIIIYFVSIFFILIGMRRMLKRIRKMKITEIYRETT